MNFCKVNTYNLFCKFRLFSVFKVSRHIYDQIYGKVFEKTILKWVAFLLSKMKILLKNIKYNFINYCQ